MADSTGAAGAGGSSVIPGLAPMDPNENLGPATNIVCWTLIAVSGVFLGLRVYCKLLRHRGLWWDDDFLIVAWLCILASHAIVTVNIAHGLGRHVAYVSPENFELIGKNGNVGATLAMFAVMWSKTSFAITLLRFTKGWSKVFVWFVIAVTNILSVVSCIVTWVRCTPVEKTWNPTVPGYCWDPSVFITIGYVGGSLSAFFDIVLSLLPWTFIWGVQMKRKEKIGVGIAMSLGIFAGAMAIVKLTKLQNVNSSDFTYQICDLVIWGTIEATVSVIACSIPILRVLIKEVRTSARKYATGGSSGQNGAGAGAVSQSKATRKSNNVFASHHSTLVTSPIPDSQAHIALGDASDKGSLEESDEGIRQTREVRLEYHPRDEKDIYEMDRVARAV